MRRAVSTNAWAYSLKCLESGQWISVPEARGLRRGRDICEQNPKGLDQEVLFELGYRIPRQERALRRNVIADAGCQPAAKRLVPECRPLGIGSLWNRCGLLRSGARHAGVSCPRRALGACKTAAGLIAELCHGNAFPSLKRTRYRDYCIPAAPSVITRGFFVQ